MPPAPARSRFRLSRPPFRRRVKAVRDQVQKHARDLLGKEIDVAGVGIEILFQHDVEAFPLGAGAMIGKV